MAIAAFNVQAQDSSSIQTLFDTAKVHTVYSNRSTLNTNTIGHNTQIITQADIKQLPVQTTAEILSYLLGVDIRQRGPMGIQSDIQIQGSTFDQVLVLIDGVKMSDPQTGHHQMNLSISPEAIDRIEIIKGAAARRYGLNALAGVVNIVTKLPKKATTVAQIHGGSSGKNNGKGNLYSNQGFRLFNGFSSQYLKAWFDVNADLGNGYRHNTDFQSIRSNFRIQQIIETQNTNIKPGGFRLNYSGSVVRNAFGANGFYAAPADSNSYEYVNTQWGSISADIATKAFGDFNVRLNGRANNDQYIFIKSNPGYYRNFHQTTVLNPEFNYRLSRKYYEVGAGLEYRKEAINSTNLGDHLREFYGAYLDVTLMPIKDLRISGGLYNLNNKILGNKIYPGADINYRLFKQIYTFASYGTGQRLPTYTDLYYSGPSNLSNPLLKAENATYMDFGFKGNVKNFTFQAAVFQRDNNDLIDRVKDSLNAPWMPVNVQSFAMKGFEGHLAYQFKWSNVLTKTGGLQIRVKTGITVLESSAINTGAISQFTLNYLPMQSISQVSIQHKRFGLSYNLRYIERYGLKTNEKTDYLVMDTRIDYRPMIKGKTGLTTWVSIQNIGNTEYKEFTAIPLLPRWVSLGVTAVLR